MDRPRLIRGLRIAVSGVCGILCVLLIVLWVRSYWMKDELYYVASYNNVLSSDGELHVKCLIPSDLSFGPFTTFRPTAWNLHYSYVITLVVLVGAVPWINKLPWSKRFSLRTLLIATTLVAVLLGLVVWAMK